MTVKIKNDGTILIDKIVVGTPIRTVQSAGISGVNALGAIDGDVLVYNAVTSLWEAKSSVGVALVDGGNY
tara:strand:+ start:2160 stop:2369 length:210 start_codon:yes stop_codon:yes gene_type:complete